MRVSHRTRDYCTLTGGPELCPHGGRHEWNKDPARGGRPAEDLNLWTGLPQDQGSHGGVRHPGMFVSISLCKTVLSFNRENSSC